MRQFNNFVLGIPYIFLMKVPYLWLPAVALYTWPPLASLLLSGIILLGLLAMNWQNSAWIDKVRHDFAHDPDKIFVQTVPPPAGYVVRSILLLLALSVVLGWQLNGRFGLNWLQWGLFTGGFVALYKKALLFGRRVTYIFTDRGLSIRYAPGHLDYRLLIRFNEIRIVYKTGPLEKIPANWTVIAPVSKVNEGLLLVPRDSRGFSTQIDQIFLSSNDLETLMQKFPPALIGSIPPGR